MSETTQHSDYPIALAAIIHCIQASQARAVPAVNAELLGLHWDSRPHRKLWQLERKCGSAGGKPMARETSLFAMRPSYAFFSPHFKFVPQVVRHLPWRHITLSDSYSTHTPQ